MVGYIGWKHEPNYTLLCTRITKIEVFFCVKKYNKCLSMIQMCLAKKTLAHTVYRLWRRRRGIGHGIAIHFQKLGNVFTIIGC